MIIDDFRFVHEMALALALFVWEQCCTSSLLCFEWVSLSGLFVCVTSLLLDSSDLPVI